MEMLSWYHVTLQLFGKQVRILQRCATRPRYAAVVKARAYKAFSWMVSWKLFVILRREEHMLSFTLEMRSLICDAAIIRPSQYGQTVSDAVLIKLIKSRKQIWMEEPPSHLSLSINTGLSQAVMNFWGTTKICVPHPKPKPLPEKKRKIQIGSRFGECKPGWSPWERLFWHPVATQSHCVFFYLFLCLRVKLAPFSEINQLISLDNAKC